MRKIITIIFETILNIIGIALIIKWYDWKLLIILFVILWANNIMISNR